MRYSDWGEKAGPDRHPGQQRRLDDWRLSARTCASRFPMRIAMTRVFREAGLPPGYARFQRACSAKRTLCHDLQAGSLRTRHCRVFWRAALATGKRDACGPWGHRSSAGGTRMETAIPKDRNRPGCQSGLAYHDFLWDRLYWCYSFLP